jgi:hypothetical protein
MVTYPLASGIRPILEAQEGLYTSQTGFISGFSPEAFPINGYARRQRRFDNGVSLSIHKTVELFNP